METQFAGNIEILVLRNGREVARVVRPLRSTPQGMVVRYKRRLWPVNGNSINVSAAPLAEVADDAPEIEAFIPAAKPDLPAAPEVPDDGQKRVIGADPEARLEVDAGPGTGKTHTACQRVAALIKDHDIPASRIWIISFTRTAVHEIRNRLAALLDDAASAASVRVATLDSVAWTVHSGFSKDATLTGSYDDNIAQTLKRIRENPDVQEEFQKLRHIVVDEAQDIVGVRAELVLSMIDAVSEGCGVTVFSDRAQAIYGFTEDDSDNVDSVRLLDELEDRGFTTIHLLKVHRTDSPTLLEIFTDVRRVVLTDSSPDKRGTEVRSEIRRLASAEIGPAKNLKIDTLPANGLVLMRQRCDVLLASSYNQDTRHRLRMSGLPVRVLPWCSLLLWNNTERLLTRARFDDLWQTQVAIHAAMPDRDAAWSLLVEAAGQSEMVVDTRRLREVLGRSGPPAMFTSPEYGDEGPILGTIHASKGREAEEVCLYLPPEPEEDDETTDADEEIRVMFVGATRARKKLSVGDSPGRQSGNVDGRVWKKLSRGRVQIEVGRSYDIDAKGLAGRSVFSSRDDAQRAQQFLIENPCQKGLFASQKKDLDWHFSLEAPGEFRIGALSAKVRNDLTELAKRCEAWPPPKYLPHIRSIGLRSIVLRPDDPILELLHEPWRTSGFILAPMLVGICMTRFA
jgi:hypothetical protein